jgi:hypothetical protein
MVQSIKITQQQQQCQAVKLIENNAWKKSNIEWKIHFIQIMAFKEVTRFNCIIDFDSTPIWRHSFRPGVWL